MYREPVGSLFGVGFFTLYRAPTLCASLFAVRISLLVEQHPQPRMGKTVMRQCECLRRLCRGAGNVLCGYFFFLHNRMILLGL
jgi:hypothetical protein